MGSDLLDSLHLWNEADKLKEEISFIIYRRSHSNINSSLLPSNYVLINTTFVASSSSEIRNRIKKYCERTNKIQYIFSDKTGTLTENIMSFKYLCVDGNSYHDNEEIMHLIKN